MTYLLAKFTLLFLLAAILGFFLGHWWSRRRMVDVTESYEYLRRATERTDQANWSRLWHRLDSLPADFAPVERRLDSLAGKIDEIPAPPAPEPVDLQPVRSDLSDIRERIGAIPGVDLGPLDNRLHGVEAELGRLGRRLAVSSNPPTPPLASPAPKPEEPLLLRSAMHGEKDDLKRISGVGPKLERLLNDNGVYYFWQVASWSGKDVAIIDEKLEAFRGRISRDNWVAQAETLKRAPDAARMPAG